LQNKREERMLKQRNVTMEPESPFTGTNNQVRVCDLSQS